MRAWKLTIEWPRGRIPSRCGSNVNRSIHHRLRGVAHLLAVSCRAHDRARSRAAPHHDLSAGPPCRPSRSKDGRWTRGPTSSPWASSSTRCSRDAGRSHRHQMAASSWPSCVTTRRRCGRSAIKFQQRWRHPRSGTREGCRGPLPGRGNDACGSRDGTRAVDSDARCRLAAADGACGLGARRCDPRVRTTGQIWAIARSGEAGSRGRTVRAGQVARASLRTYLDLTGAWETLGLTPLKGYPLPQGMYRLRIAKPGYEPLDIGYLPPGVPRSS